ncbi:MAG TPA: 4Fe-4S binding protein [Thermodesulfobacteriaceae bacterium]|nr:4Fe-4S binding protein [Thermodesulfobacteriaceae bacterium]
MHRGLPAHKRHAGAEEFPYGHRFDPIHPAGLVILVAVLTIAVLLRKGFCRWICPIGFVSNIAE